MRAYLRVVEVVQVCSCLSCVHACSCVCGRERELEGGWIGLCLSFPRSRSIGRSVKREGWGWAVSEREEGREDEERKAERESGREEGEGGREREGEGEGGRGRGREREGGEGRESEGEGGPSLLQ